MSTIFDRKHKKKLNYLMIVVGIIIVISMMILYFPAISYR